MTTLTFDLRSDPNYRAADDELDRMRSELAAAEAELDARERDRATPHETGRGRAVEAVLAGRSASAVLAEPEADANRADQLHETRNLLRRAIDRQVRIVAEARKRASIPIAKAARPGYMKLMQRITSAVYELAAAADAERDFRHALIDADIALGDAIFPVTLPDGWTLRLNDSMPRSNATMVLDEIRDHYGIRPD